MASPLAISFNLPFAEAIAAARARKVELPEDYYARIPGEMRRAATTISGLAGLDQIQEVVDAFDQFMDGTKSVSEWVRDAESRNWGLPRGRLETILRTNVQTAYSAGHWRSFEENKRDRPFLMWSAINDSRVRPTHLAMDGHIAPIDDPIWRVWHPPAGYNCRCSQISLTEEQAHSRGYGKQVPPQAKPDKGFEGGDPGSVTSGVETALEQRRADVGELGLLLDRVASMLRGRSPLEPATAIQMHDFVQAATRATHVHETLFLAVVENAAAIEAATNLTLIGFSYVLDNHGIKHALKMHGPGGEHLLSDQRPISQFDFLRIPEIVLSPGAIKYVGVSRVSRVPLIRFIKRIGNEIFYYTAEVRNGRKVLAPMTLWVEPIR